MSIYNNCVSPLLFLQNGLLAAVLLLTPWLCAQDGTGPARIEESFDSGWRFMLGDAKDASLPGHDDSQWRKLDVPHDWSIEGRWNEQAATGRPGGYLPAGIGWYRKHFLIPESWRGRKVAVRFDGIQANSDVWINGRHLGRWPYGYTTFEYDLSPYLNFGDNRNVIAVRADNARQPASRWYAGAGIYRHVWMIANGPLHVPTWGVFVTTEKATQESASLNVATSIRNEKNTDLEVTLETEILDANGSCLVAVATKGSVGSGAEIKLGQPVAVRNPRLWSPNTPTLYKVRSTLRSYEGIEDRVETTFGIRTLSFDAKGGFALNGRPTKMLGMCVHHDGGAVGAAVPEEVLERRLRLLKEMGCNAVRTAHNPMAPEFYDLCDRLGLLVLNEAFDEWLVRKPQIKVGYSEVFAEWHERDLINFIRRDRNHPCVVMWSAGNEIGDQLDPRGTDIVRRLVSIFHREDPTRLVTAGLDFAYADRRSAPREFVDALDVAGYNYVDRYGARRSRFFADDRSAYPARLFLGSEDAAVSGDRSNYEFRALPAGTPARAVYATSMIRTAELWKFALTHDYVIGHFMWVGIDYLGESQWPRRSFASGALDTAGFAKDAYYFYQSLFTDKPMLHLFPHWNWKGREGRSVPVLAYTNCEVVELFVNGRSLGAKALEFPRRGAVNSYKNYPKPQVYPTTADVHLSWDVPYEPGLLRAVGYKDGKQVCVGEVRTTGTPAALNLHLEAGQNHLAAGKVAHVIVRVVDAQGMVVPNARTPFRIQVEGAGSLVGLDNGSASSLDAFKGNVSRAWGGLCLALVEASKRETGEIRIKVEADGLAGATLVLHSVAKNRATQTNCTAIP